MDSQAAWMMAGSVFGDGGMPDVLRPMVSGIVNDLGNLYFFIEIKNFVNDRIDRFMEDFVLRTMSLVMGLALMLMTLWVLLKGLRIIAGKSQESMMGLVMDSLRASLIVAAATATAAGGSPLIMGMTDGLTDVIYQTVTGEREDDPFRAIDRSLGYMQLAMLSIDALQVSGDETIAAAKTRAQVFTGVGIAGPALVGGTMLMLNRIALALFVGLGPIFIMCLLFDATKALFSKWLLFGIGAMFSLAVLSVMVSIALDAVLAVATSFWVGSFLGANTEGISSMALQQGGLGVVMTMLIVTVPPMAANFFQGSLGQFGVSNVFPLTGGGFRGGGGSHHSSGGVSQPQRHGHDGPGYAPGNMQPYSMQQHRMSGDAPPPHAGSYNPATSPRTQVPMADEIKSSSDRKPKE